MLFLFILLQFDCYRLIKKFGISTVVWNAHSVNLSEQVIYNFVAGSKGETECSHPSSDGFQSSNFSKTVVIRFSDGEEREGIVILRVTRSLSH